MELAGLAFRAIVAPLLQQNQLPDALLYRLGSGWRVVYLVAPGGPPGAGMAREKLEIWPEAAFLDDVIQLVRLPRVLPFPRRDEIYLVPAGVVRADFASRPEENQLRDVPEVEADTAAVRSAVLAGLVPDEIALVGETPGSA